MRFITLLLESILLMTYPAPLRPQTPAGQGPGKTTCSDDYLATLHIPPVSTLDASAKMLVFKGGGWGHEVDVATPSAYVNWQRQTAAKYMTEYAGPSDKDKLAVLRVWVNAPTVESADNLRYLSVYNVVLRSGDHSAIVHPLCAAAIPVTYGNTGITANGMLAVFPMKDLEDLLRKGSVVVTFVDADGNSSDFKLDKKKLATLGLNGSK